MRAWWLTAIGTLITGFCYSLQKLLKKSGYRLPDRVAYYNDGIAFYFRTLLIVLFLRSFIFEWAIVPSESLKPTLLAGDRLLTDKSAYGIRLPITGHLLIPRIYLSRNTPPLWWKPTTWVGSMYYKQPRRGDVVVCRSPVDSSNTIINRLIGLPGDRIQYVEKQLAINGKQVSQVPIGIVNDPENQDASERWLLSEENLEGCIHQVYTHANPSTPKKTLEFGENPIDIIVPSGYYFVMGDHRDNSIDSRVWGCIPDRYLLGKAKRIYLSWDKPMIWWKPHTLIQSISWKRLGMKIK